MNKSFYQIDEDFIEISNKQLGFGEKILLGIILHLHKSYKDGVYTSNKRLAKAIGTSETYMYQMITTLVNKELISIIHIDDLDGKRRYIIPNIVNINKLISNK